MASASAKTTPDMYASLQTPDIESMQLDLEGLVQQGILTPEQAQAALVEQSQMAGVSQDPTTKQAQMEALQGLQDITSSGGLTAIDKAKLGQIATEEDTRARGAREAIMQNQAARGLGGSGMELLAQLQNQQESASRTSQRDLDVGALAQQRALDALMNQGTMAGQIGQQGFAQQAQKAQAADAIAQFNAQNQQQANMYNTQAANQAQAANLGAKQEIANANVGTANQQQQYNKQLIQQQYENELKKRGGQAGIAQANTNAQNQAAQNNAAFTNQLIGTGATIAGTAFGGPVGGAAANAATKQVTAGKANGGLIEGEPANIDNMITPTMAGEFVVRKEDVPEFLKKAHTDEDGEFDAAGFLDSITGHKYNYKGKK